MKRGPAIVLALAVLPRFAEAAPPTLESVFPPGGKRGSEIDVVLAGKFEPWPCAVWFSEKGLAFTPDPEKPGTGKLKIEEAAPAGPVLLRAHNAEGASAPAIFVIGTGTELLEEEKDGSALAAAAPLDRAQLPCAISGTLSAAGELDAWRLRLEKGETLHARVEAYGLRSLVDPVLHLHDASGHRLLLVHDGPSNLDPVLSFTATEPGDYLLALAGFPHPPAVNVAYVGSKNAHYRLHLALRSEDLPARLLPADPGPDSPGAAFVPGTPLVATLKERNTPNRHPVAAKKGDKWLVRVEGRALGYPIDPVLRILKADGSEIRREDDTNKSADPEYVWTAAEDGDFHIEVADRFGRAGEGMRYRLSAAAPMPNFILVADKNAYAMERGKELEIKLTLTRLHGHADDLAFTAVGLPESISLKAPDKAPEKSGEVVLKLEAKPDAPAFAGPIRLVAKEREESDAKERTAVFSFKDDNYRGPYAIDELPDLWLTLPPVKEEKKEEAEKPKE